MSVLWLSRCLLAGIQDVCVMAVTVFTGRDSGCLCDDCQCLRVGIPDVCVMTVTVFTGRDSGCLCYGCHGVYWQGFRMSV